ncbi:hypothetical protein PUN28_005791 [Cardiocondyla obscurior]|uniref:Ribosomal protein S14 n=1 Tax=Cardiocondyla obscurior TaxID=286306 RepID=A0AAW2GB64_9HYME
MARGDEGAKNRGNKNAKGNRNCNARCHAENVSRNFDLRRTRRFTRTSSPFSPFPIQCIMLVILWSRQLVAFSTLAGSLVKRRNIRCGTRRTIEEIAALLKKKNNKNSHVRRPKESDSRILLSIKWVTSPRFFSQSAKSGRGTVVVAAIREIDRVDVIGFPTYGRGRMGGGDFPRASRPADTRAKLACAPSRSPRYRMRCLLSRRSTNRTRRVLRRGTGDPPPTPFPFFLFFFFFSFFLIVFSVIHC